MTESQAVDIILSNMTPQIAERVIPMYPRTFDELKTFATRVEQAMRAAFDSRNTSEVNESFNSLSLLSEDDQGDQHSRSMRRRPRCYYCGIIAHMQLNCRRRNSDLNLVSPEGQQPEQPINLILN